MRLYALSARRMPHRVEFQRFYERENTWELRLPSAMVLTANIVRGGAGAFASTECKNDWRPSSPNTSCRRPPAEKTVFRVPRSSLHLHRAHALPSFIRGWFTALWCEQTCRRFDHSMQGRHGTSLRCDSRLNVCVKTVVRFGSGVTPHQ